MTFHVVGRYANVVPVWGPVSRPVNERKALGAQEALGPQLRVALEHQPAGDAELATDLEVTGNPAVDLFGLVAAQRKSER